MSLGIYQAIRNNEANLMGLAHIEKCITNV
jgi:hypothetical protein